MGGCGWVYAGGCGCGGGLRSAHHRPARLPQNCHAQLAGQAMEHAGQKATAPLLILPSLFPANCDMLDQHTLTPPRGPRTSTHSPAHTLPPCGYTPTPPPPPAPSLTLPGKGHVQLAERPRGHRPLQLRLVYEVMLAVAAAKEEVRGAQGRPCAGQSAHSRRAGGEWVAAWHCSCGHALQQREPSWGVAACRLFSCFRKSATGLPTATWPAAPAGPCCRPAPAAPRFAAAHRT